MPVLFSESFTKSYYSPIFSVSTCICLLLTIFTLILPFFAAFETNGNFKINKIRILEKYFNLSNSSECQIQ